MPLELLALTAGAFAAAFVSGAVGFGNALVAAAVWLPFFPPREAVPLIISTGLLMHVWSLRALNIRPDPARLAPFIAGGVIGAPLGAWLLMVTEPAPFRRAVGVILVAYGAVAFMLKPNALRLSPRPAADAAVGAAAGTLGSFAGLAGVLPTMWCGMRGWTPNKQRAVYQPISLVLGVFSLTGVLIAGLVDETMLIRFGICLPAVAAGLWSGYSIYARLNAAVFGRLVLGLLLVSGVSLLVRF